MNEKKGEGALSSIVKHWQANKVNKNNIFKYVVYALWNNDEIVYIGKTTQLGQRISAHARTKGFTHYSAYECEDELQMEILEDEMILEYQPKYNLAVGSGYESLEQFRGRIRSISEEHKYNPKYYIPKIRKALEENNIEIRVFRGASVISKRDVPLALDHVLNQE